MDGTKYVFINCPFDDDYKPLLHSIIFTLYYFEFEILISRNISGADVRIQQIVEHIKQARFSIHDISRCRPSIKHPLPRFNMPFELGLTIGSIYYGGRKFRDKKLLILEKERYFYQQVLSDIAGQDIENHDDDPEIAMRKVRNWLSDQDESHSYLPVDDVWSAYGQFQLSLKGIRPKTLDEMTLTDFMKLSKTWIAPFIKT